MIVFARFLDSCKLYTTLQKLVPRYLTLSFIVFFLQLYILQLVLNDVVNGSHSHHDWLIKQAHSSIVLLNCNWFYAVGDLVFDSIIFEFTF